MTTLITYDGSPLNGADHPAMPPRSRPGAPAPDAPVMQDWLLNHLDAGFTLLAIDTDAPATVTAHGLTATRLSITAADNAPIRARYLGDALTAVYLIRPDHHVAARWARYDEHAVAQAMATAIARI